MADHRRSAARPVAVLRRPVYAMLLPLAVVAFLGALITDLAYVQSGGNLQWLNFSSWLIAAGLVTGAVVLALALIDMARLRRGFAHVALLAAAWVVELVNALVHTRDGWTAVAGLGLILSTVGVVLILASGWLWQSLRLDLERRR